MVNSPHLPLPIKFKIASVPPSSQTRLTISTPLHILYQDDSLIAVDKPAGQLVHSADTPQPDDLVTMKILRDQIGQQVNPAHRLDRPTTGVLLFTTNRSATRALGRAFERHQVQKVYHAIIDGIPAQKEWTCEEPNQKTPDSPIRDAKTDFLILSHLPGNLTLIEARPHTGRYHQIRRHLLHDGHPIVGDYRYAGYDRSQELSDQLHLETRMLLQCQSLTFPHPISKEKITIQAPADPLFTKRLKFKTAEQTSGKSDLFDAPRFG